jgi:hypothetical protein
MLRRTIGMLALSGALIGFVTSLLLPRRYVARASLAIDAPASVEDAAARTLSEPSLSPLILASPYYEPMLSYTALQELVEQIRDNSVIARDSQKGCTVQFTDDDKYAALATTGSLLEEMRKNLGDAQVREPVRVWTTGPSNALCTFEGLTAGLLIGLCVWFGVSRS